MMTYVIYITDKNGERKMANGLSYGSYFDACKASEKMRMENPACKAAAVKVMRRK